MNYQDALREADEMGMVDGSIILIIRNGVLKDYEFVIKSRKPKLKTFDSINPVVKVDNY